MGAVLTAGRMITASIDKLIDGGAGLARIDGQVVFIQGVCPGERVEARVTAIKSGYAEAALERVVEPSADRIKPPCPVAGRCGGCQWQHLDYPAQLRTKIDILREDLQRIGKLTDPPLLPPIGAPRPYEYRTRIQIKLDCSHREPFIGFYAPQSRRLVPIDRCLVAAPPLNHVIAALRPLLADPATRLPSLEEAHLHLAPGTGELQCRYVTQGEPKKRVEAFLAAAGKQVEGLVSQVYYDRSGHRRVWGRDWIVDRIHSSSGDRSFRISDRSFAQVNAEQNEALIDTVTLFASLTGRESVLELYCGIGNFGLFLAPAAKSLYGIDENKSAISDARENASTQGIANVRFTARPVEETVEELAQGTQRWDLIVADPPRDGLGRRVVDALMTLKPSRMIYISCVPATLARDLKQLSAGGGAGGYRVARILPVDLFPQTPYLESVTELILS